MPLSQISNGPGSPVLIPAGTSFSADDITYYQGKDAGRTLAEAINEADLVVSCPHSGDAIPEELAEFLAPEFTHRLQFDYSDRTTGPICQAWAEVDSRILYVQNPHPRLLRDPNRAKPEDLGAQLREAFARVRAAGTWNRVDLSGVDTIRPVTFSFYPLLKVPETDAELNRMVAAFADVASRGLEVYEKTRDELRDALLESATARITATGQPGHVVSLSFHDTMNHTTTRDGAVNVERAEPDRLPAVVALSNRGDGNGERRGDEVVTMDPEMLRILADCHRVGFNTEDPAAVALNKPYLGSQEIIAAGAQFRSLTDSTFRRAVDTSQLAVGAVQAEFLREFLLGEAATAALQQPGTGWPEEDSAWTAHLAHACKNSWDEFRAYLANPPQ
ncbi:N-formylglutamate amidohydrolase [Arthrobacter sp. GMC3]|uniref:N-formylglutamate amidohydrolase n=1 Tax=Arthrobacter sp. GMC3 TaxID=2058894 RepID=UPI000CE4A2E6|nr:N-formylglutamate amidohydrolase [Arthrobacter sp. GMC3]